MRSAEELDEEWAKALADTPMVRYSVSVEKQREYWNKASNTYDDRSGEFEDGYIKILRLLQEKGRIRPEDDVLDIGSGTGMMSIPMAGIVKMVTAIDQSPGMNAALSRKANGINNIRIMMEDWNEYRPLHRFHLVTSSFCPAVYNLRSMLKMEVCSDRDCCIVALYDGGDSYFPNLAWKSLTGETFSNDGLSLKYAVQIVEAMGRDWGIDSTLIRSSLTAPYARVLDTYRNYFSTFFEMNEEMDARLAELIGTYTSAGIFDFTVVKRIGVLHWAIPK